MNDYKTICCTSISELVIKRNLMMMMNYCDVLTGRTDSNYILDPLDMSLTTCQRFYHIRNPFQVKHYKAQRMLLLKMWGEGEGISRNKKTHTKSTILWIRIMFKRFRFFIHVCDSLLYHQNRISKFLEYSGMNSRDIAFLI